MPEEAKKLPTVFLGLPVYGGESLSENVASIENVVRRMDSHGWGVYTYRVAMSDVVDARNCMLTYWYDSHPESDYLLMIDADMVFDWQMVIKMFVIDKPVVGCIYSKKHLAEPGKDGKTNFWDITVGEPLAEQIKQPIIDGFQQWKYLGAGVLLIKREVITKMLEKFPELNDFTDPGFMSKSGVSRVIGAFDKIIDADGRHLSEDISFCHRWRECGGEIWAAVGWTVGHRGLFTYNFNARSMLGLDGEEPSLPRREYIPAKEYDQQDQREITWLAKKIEGSKSLLEIGSAAGQSLKYLSAGLIKGAKIRAIDLGVIPPEGGKHAGVQTIVALEKTAKQLREQGFDVEIFLGDSHSKDAIVWAREQRPEGGYDAVFIDGDHTLEGVRQDYADYAPLGRIVALHDVANEGTEVPKFWAELKDTLPVNTLPVESFIAEQPGMGIGIVRHKLAKAWAA